MVVLVVEIMLEMQGRVRLIALILINMGRIMVLAYKKFWDFVSSGNKFRIIQLDILQLPQKEVMEVPLFQKILLVANGLQGEKELTVVDLVTGALEILLLLIMAAAVVALDRITQMMLIMVVQVVLAWSVYGITSTVVG